MISEDTNIYALKLDQEGENATAVEASLRRGEGRFGWSYVPTADLRALRERIEHGDEITDDEQNCYQEFLLDLKPGDFVVYVNVPEYGQCTLARVTGPYYWNWEGTDFNHRFPVEPTSVRTFHRNDAAVHPYLRARLKLRGRKWRIYAAEEFAQLLARLADGTLAGQAHSTASDRGFLRLGLDRMLQDVARAVQASHPNTSLERLVMECMRRVPGVKTVENKAGPNEHGADLVVTFEDGLAVGGLSRQRTCVVQVKSYEGTHAATGAVAQIERALDFHGADVGLIVSSALETGADLERAVEAATEKRRKPIGVLIGAEFARFVLKYGADVI